MDTFVTTKGVKKIVDSKDNIIDQMKELRKYAYRKGVRQFIDRVIRANTPHDYDKDSKYILYCVVKYFYQLDVVKEVKLNPSTLLPWYALSDTYDFDFIRELVTSKDNIIDQCKLLREHRDSSDVQEYVALVEKDKEDYTPKDFAYVKYCLDKYYHNRNVPKVEPIMRLYAYVREKEPPEEILSDYTSPTDIKKGDRIKFINGAFKNLSGQILSVDLEHNNYTICLNLFGQETQFNFDIDNEYNKFIKVDDDDE